MCCEASIDTLHCMTYCLLEITTFGLMSNFSRVQSLYLQGAPPKIVVDEIKRCSEWEGVSFQDQFAHDVNITITMIIK